jgi:hypothetical protein
MTETTMTALEEAIRAIRKIETQAELNQLTEVWKMQSTYIGNKNKRGLKIGDLVNWESRGFVKSGTIRKINRKTMEIVEPNNGGWGRTVYKVPASMVIGKVEE